MAVQTAALMVANSAEQTAGHWADQRVVWTAVQMVENSVGGTAGN